MKITGVRTRLYETALSRPLGDANHPEGATRRLGMALLIDTDEGLTGVNVVTPIDPVARTHIHALVEGLLIGRDPRGVRGLWKKMADGVFRHGSRGILGDSLSAIDVALWDLKSKANDEPLWKTLGASTRRVKAYASGIDTPLSDEELRGFYEGVAKKGIEGGKLKVGLDRDADLRRLGIMSEALATSGKPPVLFIDSNEYWSPKQAIRHIRCFEEQYDIAWAEEPARRWDYNGLRKVSQGIRAAVATGENLQEPEEFAPLVANGAVDVVQIHYRQSGITGALMVADLAYAHELPVSTVFCTANFMAHVAAALPNHWTMEVVDSGVEAVMNVDNRIEDGWIVLGDSPGLGIAIDEDELARLAVEEQAPGAGAWGRRRGAGLYEVPVDEPDWPEE